nr:RpiB/LacA/LacB family sugar-phosphate isomerase [Lactobacillus delbrueckii]
MKIAMANDHAGTRLKNEIKAYLEEEGYEERPVRLCLPSQSGCGQGRM